MKPPSPRHACFRHRASPLTARAAHPHSGGGDFATMARTTISRPMWPAPVSLHEHLVAQLGFATRSPAERLIGREIIDGIDEAGYLTLDLAELAERLGGLVGARGGGAGARATLRALGSGRALACRVPVPSARGARPARSGDEDPCSRASISSPSATSRPWCGLAASWRRTSSTCSPSYARSIRSPASPSAAASSRRWWPMSRCAPIRTGAGRSSSIPRRFPACS